MALALTACSDDSSSSLLLDGETRVEAITVSGSEGEISQADRTITVSFPVTTDLSGLRVDRIELSKGAACDLPAGTLFDGTMPRAITVTNGDVYDTYILTTRHERAEFLSFTLDGKYSGTIDNTARTIQVFVPMETDVTAMIATYELSLIHI